MSARSEQVLPFPFRWAFPVAGLALLAAVASAIRRRAREPRVGAMSDHWLREHASDRID